MVSGNCPSTESYFRRWASVLVSVRSLTATNSTSLRCKPARTTFRPIRPKPLMPTLTAIVSPVFDDGLDYRSGYQDAGIGSKAAQRDCGIAILAAGWKYTRVTDTPLARLARLAGKALTQPGWLRHDCGMPRGLTKWLTWNTNGQTRGQLSATRRRGRSSG